MSTRILVVEDDPASGGAYTSLLDVSGYKSERATTYEEAEAALADPPAACIVDIRLPGPKNGLDFVRLVRGRLPACIVVVVTAEPLFIYEAEAYQAGADAVLQKPVDWSAFLGSLPKPTGPEVAG